MQKLILILLHFILFQNLFAQAESEKYLEKWKKIHTEFQEKDIESKKKVSAKYRNFFQEYKLIQPEISFSNPVSASFAEKVEKHSLLPGKKKEKKIFAKLNENYSLRSEPSSKNVEFIEHIKKGEKLEVVFCMEGNADDGLNWCLVRLANKTEGYIYRDLLSNQNTIVERKHRKLERRMGKQLVVMSTILSVHETADIESKIIGSLNRGEMVQKIEGFEETNLNGRVGSWIRIQTEKDSGFVFDADVKEVELKPVVKEKLEFNVGETWFVKADRLNLREEPNQTSSVLTSLINSDEVKILEVSKKETIGNIKSNWVKIESKKNEISGWVFAGFLSKEKSILVINDEIGKPFQFPLNSNKNISSAYGPRINPITKKAGNFHSGIDIVAKVGTPIQAASDGEVSEVLDYGKRGYGRLMIVSHANDFFTYYAHQSKFESQKKDKVKAGQIIGYVGNTGASTGPHLHFEVRKGREHYDPKKFVPME